MNPNFAEIHLSWKTGVFSLPLFHHVFSVVESPFWLLKKARLLQPGVTGIALLTGRQLWPQDETGIAGTWGWMALENGDGSIIYGKPLNPTKKICGNPARHLFFDKIQGKPNNNPNSGMVMIGSSSWSSMWCPFQSTFLTLPAATFPASTAGRTSRGVSSWGLLSWIVIIHQHTGFSI